MIAGLECRLEPGVLVSVWIDLLRERWEGIRLQDDAIPRGRGFGAERLDCDTEWELKEPRLGLSSFHIRNVDLVRLMIRK